jgi:hypothetical protein
MSVDTLPKVGDRIHALTQSLFKTLSALEQTGNIDAFDRVCSLEEGEELFGQKIHLLPEPVRVNPTMVMTSKMRGQSPVYLCGTLI